MVVLPHNEEVDVRTFERILDLNNMTTSYKLYWFLGIFKEIINGNQEIDFRRIVSRMVACSWYSLVEYHLNFGAVDKLNELVLYIYNEYDIETDINENTLLDFLEHVNDDKMERKYKDFYKYVPFRLLQPFFSDKLVGMKDYLKNKVTEDLSNQDPDVLYRIDSKAEKIYINQKWFNYIYQNQNIINGWLNYKLIYYLQKKNPNVPAIPFKLSAPGQRDLTNAKQFWENIVKIANIRDIYINKSFTEENFYQYGELSIDHFIPWSFVRHDELWNLVPTFKNVNSSKSNRLPILNRYLNLFCDVQYEAFNTARVQKTNRKFLEDYLTINKKLNFKDINKPEYKIPKPVFVDSLKSTINPLFQIAYNQGYEVWSYKLV